MNWHSKSYGEPVEEYGSHISYGLTVSQAQKHIEKYGKNQLEEAPKTSILAKFFMQLNDFMIIMLIIAAGVSAGLSLIQNEPDFLDPIIIMGIVILNAALGVFQENKAEKALEALKQISAPRSRVIRNGKTQSVETPELVPGDIILLRAGDMVGADARLIESVNLAAEESALSGESAPVEKHADSRAKIDSPIGDRHNMVFAGTTITNGRAKAIVVATGMNTEMGHIAGMIIKSETPLTPLQKSLAETGKALGIAALVICVLIFVIGILRQFSPMFMFMTSVSLAVAAIPEGLPAIVTIMLAIGVQRMAGRNAVIRKLPAVETLGSATVICSDKTGTLTQNKMRVVAYHGINGPLAQNDNNRRRILEYGCLCNDTVMETKSNELDLIGDPTETALVSSAFEVFLSKNDLDRQYARVAEIPFDSKRKLMTTLHKCDDGYLLITKGAPDVLAEKCDFYAVGSSPLHMDYKAGRDLLAQNNIMAAEALRVLAIAYKKLDTLPKNINEAENNLIFLGLIGIMDPPRPEALHAVKLCKKAGILPVMVTGDHVITARAIGEKLGIITGFDKAISGAELNKLTQEELETVIDDYKVFARVSPEHKVRIVKAFQARGNIVAMTGDGINDAPALKAADIGCAMGITGTDVAKGAADMILMDDNFATIVEAVREGRGIYANITKAVHFLLSSNIGEIITILVSILAGWGMPLVAIQLLWVNLITDSLPAIALGLDPAQSDIMNRPTYKNNGLFTGELWKRIFLEGAMIGALALIAFGYGKTYFDRENAFIIGRTMCFATLSISQLVHAFNMRSDKSLKEINPFSNFYLVGAFIIGFLLQIIVINLPSISVVFKTGPLNIHQWAVVLLLCAVPIAVVELEKFVLSRLSKKKRIETVLIQDTLRN